ncbi:MAG TPA: IS5 family transposase, partial [Candidatus Methanoperedenaceae archaeon]|nr:IS5 family transposase [Candidatus Methanoperedenaceae archaeon]
KLILALEHPSLKPLAFLLFPGSPNDSMLFDCIVNELMRRRVMRKGDTMVLDKGFYAYYHYTDG